MTVSPVPVAMPTEKEAEPRSIGVVAGGISVVVVPIRPATMEVTTMTPASPIAIVDRFCRTTRIYRDVLEARDWRRGSGSAEHAKCEHSRRKAERLNEHSLSFLFLA
jgi:hypothetical protein